MFGQNEKTKIESFLEVSALIIKADLNGLTATQKKAISAISEKLSKPVPDSFSAMRDRLRKRPTSGKKAKPKKPPLDPATLASILSNLETLVRDRQKFEVQVAQLNKSHTAPELKKIAAAFAAGARASTKADAVRILKAERNDRERAAVKATEAGKARPW